MPLWHCTGCHHEWEATRRTGCDWCGHDGYVLRTKTELERMAGGQCMTELEREGHRIALWAMQQFGLTMDQVDLLYREILDALKRAAAPGKQTPQ